VAGSASIKGKTLFITLTNTHAASPVEVNVHLLGSAAAQKVSARVLCGEIHTHNTFDQPEALILQPLALAVSGSTFTIPLPPASAVAAEVTLD
jgi:alpha-N-arabinofuranosidase